MGLGHRGGAAAYPARGAVTGGSAASSAKAPACGGAQAGAKETVVEFLRSLLLSWSATKFADALVEMFLCPCFLFFGFRRLVPSIAIYILIAIDGTSSIKSSNF
jgi:hypothetical protein